jgi:ParB/RepB/Spo0J family partition protein
MATATAHEIREIKIRDINVDPHHPRRMSADAFEASCQDLAGKIAVEGMLQPVKVCADPDNHGGSILVWGLRRMTAAKLLGWETIPAINGGAMTQAEIEAERLSENLNREDPSPIDEMVGVDALYEATREATETMATGQEIFDDGGLHNVVVESVAERLGKTPSWVRDRLYLRRLAPTVQELVIDGSIPLAHARELAKLGDEKEQLDLAYECARDEDGVGGMSLHELSFRVGRRLTKLAGVLWPLDQEFAGKPACEGCQHNTGTDVMLFEGGAEPEKAHCLSKGCYNAKSKAANKAADKAVTKIVKLTVGGKLESSGPKILVEKGLVPKGVKPASLAARVRARIARDNPAPAPKSSAAVSKPSAQTPEQKHESAAYEAWRAFERERYEKESSVVDEAIKAQPLKLFAMWLLSTVERRNTDPICKKHRDKVNRFITDETISIGQFELVASQIIRSVFGGERSWMVTEFYLDDVAGDIAELLLGKMPDQDEWIRRWMEENPLQAEEPKPAGKKKAGKKAAKKKTARRSPRKGAAS